ncbi:GNAT family N-acetyltransferase [Kitasatospora sp. NPDC101155]|uniref:GNAT family N-acetyltransferase n=1 Tax=Kitasatospora sp. NPDC101155 TaxID=3364097 RepID=UPI00382ECC5A
MPIPLSVGDAELAVVGMGGLAVAPGRRDGSLARALLEAAFDHARTLGSAHALAFCRPRLVPYYERRGFHELAAEVTVEQPGGRLVVMPLRTIWAPLHDGAEWPAGGGAAALAADLGRQGPRNEEGSDRKPGRGRSSGHRP